MKTAALVSIIGAMGLFMAFKIKTSISRETVIARGHMPNVAADGDGNIHVVYGTGDSIMYLFSTNKGDSFSKPRLVAVLPEVFANAMRGPQVALTSKGIVIIANTRYGNVYSYRKEEGGKWSGATKVNDIDSVSKEALTSLGADGSKAFAVWLDARTNGGKGQRLYGARSVDGGISWSRNIMVYASPDSTICECCKPSVLVEGNKVFAMFRNWLNGSRDLYLVKSFNDGQSFNDVTKLGVGSWTLKGCPMDGGGFAMHANGMVETVWRREGNIYGSTESNPEVLLGQGRSCAIELVGGKPYYTWTNKGDVLLMTPDKQVKVLGKGSGPLIKKLSNKKLICVWENENEIHASVHDIENS